MNAIKNAEQKEDFTHLEVEYTGKYALGSKGGELLYFYGIEKNTLEQISTIDGHMGPVTSISFSKNGKYAVSTDFAGGLIFMEISNGNVYKKFIKQITENKPIYDTAMLTGTVGNETVFCGCENGEVHMIDVGNGIEQNSNVFVADEDAIISLDCNSDYLITASSSGNLKYTQICGNKLLDSKKISTFHGEISSVKITKKNCFERIYIAVGLTSGGLFICSYANSEFKVLDKFELGSPVYALKWAQGGFSLSVLHGENEIKVYDLQEDNTFKEVVVNQSN